MIGVEFWDTSALVPVFINEARSSEARAAYSQAARIAIWWGTPVEFASALARYERQGESAVLLDQASDAFREQIRADKVQVTAAHDAVRERACHLLRCHPLRSADALQLAAALHAGLAIFRTFDARLAEAARAEGLSVL